MNEADAVAFGVVDLETEVAIPALAYGSGNFDAFAGKVTPHAFGVRGLEGDFNEAVFVFRPQRLIDFEVLLVGDFEPGGGTKALGHDESVGEAKVMAVEMACGGEVIGLERDMGDSCDGAAASNRSARAGTAPLQRPAPSRR